ncbi:hypothetical protein L5515_016272 [Caenorhabditis briggsae]|nr:hypothetical protein L5515_016272 [Caenorhabditis briggsae]
MRSQNVEASAISSILPSQYVGTSAMDSSLSSGNAAASSMTVHQSLVEIWEPRPTYVRQKDKDDDPVVTAKIQNILLKATGEMQNEERKKNEASQDQGRRNSRKKSKPVKYEGNSTFDFSSSPPPHSVASGSGVAPNASWFVDGPDAHARFDSPITDVKTEDDDNGSPMPPLLERFDKDDNSGSSSPCNVPFLSAAATMNNGNQMWNDNQVAHNAAHAPIQIAQNMIPSGEAVSNDVPLRVTFVKNYRPTHNSSAALKQPEGAGQNMQGFNNGRSINAPTTPMQTKSEAAKSICQGSRNVSITSASNDIDDFELVQRNTDNAISSDAASTSSATSKTVASPLWKKPQLPQKPNKRTRKKAAAAARAAAAAAAAERRKAAKRRPIPLELVIRPIAEESDSDGSHSPVPIIPLPPKPPTDPRAWAAIDDFRKKLNNDVVPDEDVTLLALLKLTREPDEIDQTEETQSRGEEEFATQKESSSPNELPADQHESPQPVLEKEVPHIAQQGSSPVPSEEDVPPTLEKQLPTVEREDSSETLPAAAPLEEAKRNQTSQQKPMPFNFAAPVDMTPQKIFHFAAPVDLFQNIVFKDAPKRCLKKVASKKAVRVQPVTEVSTSVTLTREPQNENVVVYVSAKKEASASQVLEEDSTDQHENSAVAQEESPFARLSSTHEICTAFVQESTSEEIAARGCLSRELSVEQHGASFLQEERNQQEQDGEAEIPVAVHLDPEDENPPQLELQHNACEDKPAQEEATLVQMIEELVPQREPTPAEVGEDLIPAREITPVQEAARSSTKPPEMSVEIRAPLSTHEATCDATLPIEDDTQMEMIEVFVPSREPTPADVQEDLNSAREATPLVQEGAQSSTEPQEVPGGCLSREPSVEQHGASPLLEEEHHQQQDPENDPEDENPPKLELQHDGCDDEPAQEEATLVQMIEYLVPQRQPTPAEVQESSIPARQATPAIPEKAQCFAEPEEVPVEAQAPLPTHEATPPTQADLKKTIQESTTPSDLLDAIAIAVTPQARFPSPKPMAAPSLTQSNRSMERLSETNDSQSSSQSSNKKKPKARNSELDNLLKMDFGPKEGGSLEDCAFNSGTRRSPRGLSVPAISRCLSRGLVVEPRRASTQQEADNEQLQEVKIEVDEDIPDVAHIDPEEQIHEICASPGQISSTEEISQQLQHQHHSVAGEFLSRESSVEQHGTSTLLEEGNQQQQEEEEVPARVQVDSSSEEQNPPKLESEQAACDAAPLPEEATQVQMTEVFVPQREPTPVKDQHDSIPAWEATPVVQEAVPLPTQEATPQRQAEPLETIQESALLSRILVDRALTPQPRLDQMNTPQPVSSPPPPPRQSSSLDTSSEVNESPSTSQSSSKKKPKVRSRELERLLKMDFGPKEGGNLEDCGYTAGTRCLSRGRSIEQRRASSLRDPDYQRIQEIKIEEEDDEVPAAAPQVDASPEEQNPRQLDSEQSTSDATQTRDESTPVQMVENLVPLLEPEVVVRAEEPTPVVQETRETPAVSKEASENIQAPISTHEETPPLQEELEETTQQSTPQSRLVVTPSRAITSQSQFVTPDPIEAGSTRASRHNRSMGRSSERTESPNTSKNRVKRNPKARNSELDNLLKMDFGPKEGGNLEDCGYRAGRRCQSRGLSVEQRRALSLREQDNHQQLEVKEEGEEAEEEVAVPAQDASIEEEPATAGEGTPEPMTSPRQLNRSMDTPSEMNDSPNTPESSNKRKPKARGRELDSLLKMDFGPKEGGNLEDCGYNSGTRRSLRGKSVATTPTPVPTSLRRGRSAKPKVEEVSSESEENDDEDEDEDDEFKIPDNHTPSTSTRMSTRKRSASPGVTQSAKFQKNGTSSSTPKRDRKTPARQKSSPAPGPTTRSQRLRSEKKSLTPAPRRQSERLASQSSPAPGPTRRSQRISSHRNSPYTGLSTRTRRKTLQRDSSSPALSSTTRMTRSSLRRADSQASGKSFATPIVTRSQRRGRRQSPSTAPSSSTRMATRLSLRNREDSQASDASFSNSQAATSQRNSPSPGPSTSTRRAPSSIPQNNSRRENSQDASPNSLPAPPTAVTATVPATAAPPADAPISATSPVPPIGPEAPPELEMPELFQAAQQAPIEFDDAPPILTPAGSPGPAPPPLSPPPVIVLDDEPQQLAVQNNRNVNVAGRGGGFRQIANVFPIQPRVAPTPRQILPRPEVYRRGGVVQQHPRVVQRYRPMYNVQNQHPQPIAPRNLIRPQQQPQNHQRQYVRNGVSWQQLRAGLPDMSLREYLGAMGDFNQAGLPVPTPFLEIQQRMEETVHHRLARQERRQEEDDRLMREARVQLERRGNGATPERAQRRQAGSSQPSAPPASAAPAAAPGTSAPQTPSAQATVSPQVRSEQPTPQASPAVNPAAQPEPVEEAQPVVPAVPAPAQLVDRARARAIRRANRPEMPQLILFPTGPNTEQNRAHALPLNYTTWTPQMVCEWIRAVDASELGESFAGKVLERNYDGYLIGELVTRPDEMQREFEMNITQFARFRYKAAEVVNRFNKMNHELAMEEFEDRLREWEIQHPDLV